MNEKVARPSKSLRMKSMPCSACCQFLTTTYSELVVEELFGGLLQRPGCTSTKWASTPAGFRSCVLPRSMAVNSAFTDSVV
jgi:hypothetical protein